MQRQEISRTPIFLFTQQVSFNRNFQMSVRTSMRDWESPGFLISWKCLLKKVRSKLFYHSVPSPPALFSEDQSAPTPISRLTPLVAPIGTHSSQLQRLWLSQPWSHYVRARCCQACLWCVPPMSLPVHICCCHVQRSGCCLYRCQLLLLSLHQALE